MATIPTFTWGSGGQALTPEQVERRRKVAAALAAVQPNPQTMWQGIQSAVGQIGGGLQNSLLDKQEAAARAAYSDEYAGLDAAPSVGELEKLAGNEWGNSGQQAVVSALLSKALTPKAPVETYSVLSPDEMTGLGLPPGAYQRSSTSQKISPIGDGSGVTVNTGDNSNNFQKEADQKAADRLAGYVDAGSSAQTTIGNLKALADISKNISTGKGAEVLNAIGPYAQAIGIDVKGLSETQAFQSIVDKMAPQMRPTGSGSSSDSDVRMFLNSLPSLGKTSEGNAIISETLQAVQEHNIKASDIANLAFLPKEQGGITWQEADKRIAALGDPYTAFKKANPNAVTSTKYPGVTIRPLP